MQAVSGDAGASPSPRPGRPGWCGPAFQRARAESSDQSPQGRATPTGHAPNYALQATPTCHALEDCALRATPHRSRPQATAPGHILQGHRASRAVPAPGRVSVPPSSASVIKTVALLAPSPCPGDQTEGSHVHIHTCNSSTLKGPPGLSQRRIKFSDSELDGTSMARYSLP